MQRQRKNFNRQYRLHCACAIREMRQELAYITFRGGFAYCNNGTMVVKADIRKISDFHPQEYDIMDGNSIHMDNFRRLLNYQVANVTEQGFEVNDQGRRLLIYFSPQVEIELPSDVDTLFDKCRAASMVGIHKTAVSVSVMRKAAAALGSDSILIDYYDSGKGHILTRLLPLPLMGNAEAIVYEEIIKPKIAK